MTTIERNFILNNVRQVAKRGLPLETEWVCKRAEGRDLGAQPITIWELIYMRNTAEKRHNDWKKALRKRRIDREITSPVFNTDLYDNLHQYSKNKIHCSCWMCRSKTNPKRGQGCGPGMNWSESDLRKLESMKEQIQEFDNE